MRASPAPRAWSEAAQDTLCVDGSRLLHCSPAGQRLVADGVTSAHLVEGPALALEAASGPVVIPLDAWDPGSPAAALVVPVTERLERIGVRSLLEELGRSDAWTFDVGAHPRPAGARVVAPDQRDRSASIVRDCQLFGAVAVFVLVVFAVVDVLSLGGAVVLVIVFAALSAVAVAGAVALTRASRILSAGRRRLATPVPATAAVAGLPVPVQLATAGDDLVVVTPYGDEAHFPGPGAGGVTSAVAFVQEGHGVREVRLLLRRRQGDEHPVPAVMLLASWWHDATSVGEDVLRWLRDSGVEVDQRTVPRRAPLAQDKVWPDAWRLAVLWPVRAMQLLTVVVMLAAGAAMLLAAILPIAVGWLPALLAATMIAIRLRWGWQEWQERRR